MDKTWKKEIAQLNDGGDTQHSVQNPLQVDLLKPSIDGDDQFYDCNDELKEVNDISIAGERQLEVTSAKLDDSSIKAKSHNDQIYQKLGGMIITKAVDLVN